MGNIWGRAIQTLKLEPIFGPKAWSTKSSCLDVHPRGSMPTGTKCCCMSCHRSGREHHPDLIHTAEDLVELSAWQPEKGRDEWSEPEPLSDKPQPTCYQGALKPAPVETRRQRRAKKFGERQVQAATSSPI
jgi:hypothetical protein